MVFDFKNDSLCTMSAGEVVENYNTLRYVTTISCDIKWDENVPAAIKKAHETAK